MSWAHSLSAKNHPIHGLNRLLDAVIFTLTLPPHSSLRCEMIPQKDRSSHKLRISFLRSSPSSLKSFIRTAAAFSSVVRVPKDSKENISPRCSFQSDEASSTGSSDWKLHHIDMFVEHTRHSCLSCHGGLAHSNCPHYLTPQWSRWWILPESRLYFVKSMVLSWLIFG